MSHLGFTKMVARLKDLQGIELPNRLAPPNSNSIMLETQIAKQKKNNKSNLHKADSKDQERPNENNHPQSNQEKMGMAIEKFLAQNQATKWNKKKKGKQKQQ